MDIELDLSPEDEAFRNEVREFLDKNLPPGWNESGNKPWRTEAERLAFLRDWQRRLAEAGLGAIAWPKEYGGRGATFVQQLIFSEEKSRRSTPAEINRGALFHI